MTNQPLVSIIIPTYNRAKLLPETLESVIAQTYEKWECLVIDDGSADETQKLLKDFSDKDNRIKYFKRPDSLPKSGNSCRNYGIEISRGVLVNFFDSDDIMMEDFLSSRIDLFENETQMVFATYKQVDDELNVLKEPKFEVSDYLLKDYLFWKFPILTHSMLVRKAFLENQSLFDPTIKRGQETDFFINILKDVQPNQYKIVSRPSFLYRMHENTITAKTKTYNPEFTPSLIKIRAKAFFAGKDLNDPELMKNSHLHLIILLFQAIKNKDISSVRVFNRIYLKPNHFLNFAQKTEIKILGHLLAFTGMASKKIEKRWINFLKF